MRRLMWALPAALLVAPWSSADDPKPDKKAKPALAVPATPLIPLAGGDDKKDEKKDDKKDDAKPADLKSAAGRAAEVNAIQKDYNSGMLAYSQAMRAAEKADDKQKARQEALKKMPQIKPLAERAWAVVDADAKDQPAFDALIWLQGKGPQAKLAGMPDISELLLKHHLDNPKIGQAINTQSSEKFLRAVAEKAKDPAGKARALYTLAGKFQNEVMSKQRLLDRVADGKDKDAIEKATKELAAVKAHEKEAEALFGKIVKDKELADAVYLERGDLKITFGQRAEGDLFEMRHLSVGKTAPDIIGEDLDGKPIKLSDYRGQVVMLDFWGHW